MKKILISFLLIMHVTLSFSQFPEAPLPELYPVSPEAASLGRYGNLQPSLHTGNMNFSIPIHQLQVGPYSWPVSLNYSFGGLVLESKPSVNGLGWNMSGMGAVTREVRGLPDEHPQGYYGSDHVGQRIYDYVENNNVFNLDELRRFLNNVWDGEADIYHVNAGPVSFSFKMGLDGNPVYLSQHNHIVTYLDEQITVTDDNGVVYVFADRETNIPSDASPSTSFTYTTSWYLSTITYPNQQYINFHYQDDQYVSYDFSAKGLNTYIPNGLLVPTPGGTTSGPTYFIGGYDDKTTETFINRKLLKAITSSGYGTIDFTIGNRGSANERKVYTGIKVSKDGTEDNFTFSYEGVRDLMTQVTKNGQLVYGFEYFDQGMPSFLNSLADRAHAQDSWGFYNAATSNQSAINIPYIGMGANNKANLNATKLGGIRKIIYPTGGHSLINYEQNTVKKLYTAASVEEGNLAFNRQILVKLQSDNNTIAPVTKTAEFSYTFQQPVVAYISHQIKGTRQNSNMQVSLSRTDACPPPTNPNEPVLVPFSDAYYENAPGFRDVYNIPIPPFCPTLAEQFGPDEGDPGYYNFNENSGGRIVIKPGTYTFKITNYYNRTSDAYAEIKVLFYEPDHDDINQPLYLNTVIGGVRVANIQHFSDPEQNTIATTQYFNYNTDDKLSSGMLINKKDPISYHNIRLSGDTNNPDRYEATENLHLLRFNSLDIDRSAPVYYTSVKEFTAFEEVADLAGSPVDNPIPNDTNPDGSTIMTAYGDNSGGPTRTKLVFPNGYKQTTFFGPSQNYEYVHPDVPQSKDLTKGRVNKVAVYKKQNNTVELVQQSANLYQQFRWTLNPAHFQDNNPNHPWSIKTARKLSIFADCTDLRNCDLEPTPEYEHVQIDRFIVAPYREVHSNYKKRLVTETTFYDENGNPKEVTTSTQNTYNSHYNVSETEVDFGEEGIVKSVYHYPYDALSNFDNLSSTATTGINELNGSNRIAAPIQTKVYQKEGTTETLVSTQRTDFKKWTIGTPARTLVLPEKMLIAKASNTLEERMIYHKYDTRGNPVEVSQTNGVHIYYIWGYHNTYPIAKISNFTAAQAATIQSLIDDAITASNADNGTDSNNIANETALRDALEVIRTDNALQNAQMTYSTYDPMVGVTSMTDARGYTMTYHYDDLRRLIAVKDEAGELVSENQYHFKN